MIDKLRRDDDSYNPIEARFVAYVRSRWGLAFSELRGGAFRWGLARACTRVNRSIEQVVEELGRSPEVDHALLAELTTAESYFFRHPSDFEYIASEMRKATKPMRLWSLGCATGEEAYSLAITALQVFGDCADQWVTIEASDVNPAALMRAEQAIYRPWSFRGVSDARRSHFFESSMEQVWRPIRAVRRLVRFSPVNLAKPSSAWPSRLDFIFCRNVFLYLEATVIAAATQAISARLNPGGRLVLGPTDPQLILPSLQPCGPEQLMMYERVGPDDEPDRAVPAREIGSGLVSSDVSPVFYQPKHRLDEIYRLADRGKHQEAMELLDAELVTQPLWAEAYLARALLHLERNESTQAEQDIRRARTLVPSLVVPHLLQASAQANGGHRGRALESLRQASKHLSTRSTLPGQDVRVGECELGSVIRSMVRLTKDRSV